MARLAFIFYFLATNVVNYLQCKTLENSQLNLLKPIEDSTGGKGSWVISPASVRSVLEGLFLGSGGDTRDQLGTSLGLRRRQDVALDQARLAGVGSDGVVWKMANKILVKSSLPLLDKFKSEMNTTFHSQIENSDFSDSQATADSINSWVSTNTDGLITQLISPGDVSPATSILILNAVYFKGTWKYAFKDGATAKRCFYASAKNCIRVDTMNQRSQLKYYSHEKLGAKFLQLPYNDKRYSMLIVLPNKYNGLVDVLKRLPEINLDEIVKKLDYQHLDIYLPKFSTKFKSSLNEPLRKAGVKSIFEPSADFSGMTDSSGGYVSEILHEAHITVSEKGTVAAASTGAVMTRALDSVPPKYETFNADHPFLYFITVNQTQVLFAGKFAN